MPPEQDENFDIGSAFDEVAEGIDFRSGEPKDDSDHGENTHSDSTITPVDQQQTAEQKAWDSAPASWKKDYHDAYRPLPENVRQYIHQREKETFEGLKSYRETAEAWDRIHGPYKEIYQQANATPQEITDTMLGFYAGLARGEPQQRAEILQQIVRQFGLQDLIPQIYMQLNGAAPPEGQQSQIPAEIRQQMTTLQTEIANLRKIEQDRLYEQHVREVDSFARDPKNPYFTELVPTIQEIMQKGFKAPLPELYKVALSYREDIQEKIAADRAAQAAAETGKGRPVPRNVRSSSTPPSPTGKPRSNDISQDMSDIYDKLFTNSR